MIYKNKFSDLKNLQSAVDREEQIPLFIQDSIPTTLDKDLTTLHKSYFEKKKHSTQEMADQMQSSRNSQRPRKNRAISSLI